VKDDSSILSLSDQTSAFGVGGLPPQELPARMTAFTPDEDKANIEGPRQRLYEKLAKLHSQSELTGNFCTDPDSIVELTVLPENESLIFRKQYPIAQALVDRIDEVVQRWYKEGKIAHAPRGCRFNSPLLAVPKKDEQGRMTGVRVCVDVRLLNKYLVEDDKFPLPLIPDVLAAFSGGKLFGEYDLSEAYFQFKLKVESQQYTAFTWNKQQYMFVGCPFGIKHIPSLFQRYICNLFRDMPFVFPYIDNLGFASSSWEEHYEHAARIMERLNSVNLRVKPSSINLGNTRMKLLGHVLSPEGVSIDPEKQEMIMKWERPVEGSGLASALGLGAFLRDHVRHYADITAPLEKAKREKIIEWTEERDRHWMLFKRAFASVPLLRFPDFSKRFVLATDASQTGIGGILYQPDDDDNTLTPNNIVAIASKQLDSTHRNYPVYKKELFAVIYCLRKFHSYLWGRKVTVLTDHKPLIHITSQKLMTVALQQWLDVLLDYDLEIKYRPGVLHVIPDALSRMYASTYQQHDVVWGTRSNIQILDAYNRSSSPSDSLCHQSLVDIKPMSSIKKRHQLPNNTSTKGGDKEKMHKKVKYTSKQSSHTQHSSLSESDDFEQELNEALAVVNTLTCDESDPVHGPLYAASDPLCARLAAAVIREQLPAHNVWVWPTTNASHNDNIDPHLCVLDIIPCINMLTDEEKLLLAQEKRGKRVPSTDDAKRKLVDEAHAQGHFGEKAMQHHIDRQGYWWPGLRKDLADVVKMCHACRKYTVVRAGFHPARSIDAFLPGDHFQIDLASFPKSTEGHVFCLVCVDVFTGFIFLKALKDKSATSIARALWDIFSIVGAPRILQSDNGREFKNEIITALCKLLEIPHRFIAPYNPRADGKVERSVKTVKDTVNKLMYGADCHWHLHLPFVQYAYNNKVQSLTGSTPFSLMFGRSANSPTNYEFDEHGLLVDVKDWQRHQEEMLSLIFPAVSTRRGSEQSKSRQRVDKLRRNIVDESLPVGTVVYIKNPDYAVDRSKKPTTAPDYIGPYTVVRRTAHGPYILNDDTGVRVKRVIPLDQMKVLYTPDEKPFGADELDDPGKSYEVESILNHKIRDDDGKEVYLAKWKGYPESEATWLSLDRFNDTEIVTQYLNSLHNLRRSKRLQPSSSSINLTELDMELSNDMVKSHVVHPSRLANFKI
jgi:transposase InsO family protein